MKIKRKKKISTQGNELKNTIDKAINLTLFFSFFFFLFFFIFSLFFSPFLIYSKLNLEQIYNISEGLANSSPQYETSVMKREERIIAFRLKNLKAITTISDTKIPNHNFVNYKKKRKEKRKEKKRYGDGRGDEQMNEEVKSREIRLSLADLTINNIKWAYKNVTSVSVQAIAIEATTTSTSRSTNEKRDQYKNSSSSSSEER